MNRVNLCQFKPITDIIIYSRLRFTRLLQCIQSQQER